MTDHGHTDDWISVDDRLPERGRRCIVWHPHYKAAYSAYFDGETRTFFAYFDGETRTFFAYFDGETRTFYEAQRGAIEPWPYVRFWMPTPAPPAEPTNGG